MGAAPSNANQVAPATGPNRTFILDAIREHGGGINCSALSEDSSVLATGSEDRSIRIWATKSKRCDCIGILLGHEKYVSCLLIEEIYVLSGSADATIRKWDMSTCDCVLVFNGHTARVNRIVSTGDFLFSSSNDHTVRGWDLESGECIREFVGHSHCAFALLFIPFDDTNFVETAEVGDDDDLNYKIKDILVSASSDFTARSWSFESGRTLQVFRGHQNIVTSLSCDVDGKTLMTSSTDNFVMCWRLETGELLRKLEGHTSGIICMTVVNRCIYTGSSDHTARAFNLDASVDKETLVYKGHTNTVFCIKYYDGMLFTGSSDGSVICYDQKLCEVKRVFRGPPQSSINCMQFVENRLFTGSTDGALRVWTLRGLKKLPPSAQPPPTASTPPAQAANKAPPLTNPQKT